MNILLVVPRYNLTNRANYDYTFPLGLSYISSSIKTAGYSLDCININHFNGTTGDIVAEALGRKDYDILCTGGNALMFNAIEAIVRAARSHHSHPKIILGGPIITSEPELMLDALSPDFGIIGEGEITIIKLLDAIKDKKSFRKVNGIIYRENSGNIIKTERRDFIKDIEKIPYPDFEGIGLENQIGNLSCNRVYINNIFDHPRIYPILGSRGCPFNCSFCWHDMKYRARSIKDVMRELELNVKKFRINDIALYDDCFSTTKERVYEFCREIKKLQKKVPWEIKWSCQLMVTSVDGELLKILKDTGCYAISYGFESYSPKVLRSMRKPITPEKINYALKETIKARIAIQANFILGDIAETRETARETINFWKNECMGQVGLGFVQPYPGSDLYKYCIEKRIIKDKLDYIKNHMGSDNFLNMTQSMSDGEISDINNEILDSIKKHVRFVLPTKVMPDNIRKETYYILIKCPFCRKNIKYGNCYLSNKHSFGIFLLCRNCGMRFFAVSPLQRLAYRIYPQVRAIRNMHKKFLKFLKTRAV